MQEAGITFPHPFGKYQVFFSRPFTLLEVWKCLNTSVELCHSTEHLVGLCSESVYSNHKGITLLASNGIGKISMGRSSTVT